MEDLSNPLIYIPTYFRVLTKPDATGVSDMVPMKLWPIQEHYAVNRTHRDIVLKNRQCGFSTGLLALNSHALFTQPFERQALITHDDSTSEFLLSTVHRFYNNLPSNMRPERDWKSGARLRLNKIDSLIYIDSARSDSIGIGRSLTRGHLSEVSKWPVSKADQLFADISQTVGGGGFITIESTPKGRGGIFYRLYDAAKKGEIPYKCFFYPWWWDITCIRTAPKGMEYTEEEKSLIDQVKKTENKDITPGQIAFRREKLAELGDYFYQEYAENDVDCWLSGEQSVFDGVAIRWYLKQIYKGREEGYLTVWKDVIGGEKYVIGVDVAAGQAKGDYSVATVLRIKTNEYVARLRGRIPPDIFTEELIKLGNHYNQAEIGVERASHGHTVLRILLENSYPNLYYHRDYDSLADAFPSEPGWKTSAKTKPQMISDMAAALRARDIMIYSENFFAEASAVTYEGENKINKPSGGYDDELDALMITLQIRQYMPMADPSRHKVISYARL